MKKISLKFGFAVLLSCIAGKNLQAQCVAPSPPPVSGGTIAGCVSSTAFTLTATPNGTNAIGWYSNSFGGNALTTNSVFTTPTLTSGTTYYVGQSTTQTGVDTLAMPAYSINVPAMETRGYYFTAPNDFIITGLRVPVVIGGTLSGIAVVKLPSAPPLYASVTNSFNTLFLDQAITGTNVVAVNIPVYAGDIIGVLGERGGYSAYGPNLGTGVFTSTLGTGSTTVNLYRMGMLYNLATQTPTNLWTENVNTIGMVEMYVKQSCNSTLTPVTVSLVPPPNVTVTPPPVICANSSYTLSAAGANTFTWTGGPQTSTYVVNPSTTTTYSVQGSILSTCNSTISTVTVSVDPGLPILTATSSSSAVCSGNTLMLSGSGAPTYTWASATGTISNNTAFVPLATQQYTLFGKNACGIGTAMITVTVNATPTLMTSSTPTAVCDGRSATLTVTGASTYSWDAASAPGPTLVVTPTSTGYYNVSGISSAGCPASAAHGLIVHPNPTVTAGAVSNKTLVCPGGSATLTSGGADNYAWDTGALTVTTIVNPSAMQVYTVTGSYSMTQCSSSETIAVHVYSPALSVSANTTVCYGAKLTLTASAAANSTYSWSTGSPFSTTNVTVTTSGSYSVTVHSTTVGGLNCSSTATTMVGLHPDPTVQVGSTRTLICKGEKTLLTAQGGTAYVWMNQTAGAATLLVNPVNMSQPTVYSVTGTDANGCRETATISITVKECVGIDEQANAEAVIAVYPNPNNGDFTVRAAGSMQLTLVNELGQVIRTLSFTEDNQFRHKIEGLSSGIYFIRGSFNGAPLQHKLMVIQ